MEQQYGVSLLVGELFTGVNYKDNKNKIKANIVLQHEIRDNFSRITSFEVGHQKFHSVVTNYLNKLKKNKGRKGYNEVFGEWFQTFIHIHVEDELVETSSLFSLSTASSVLPESVTPSSSASITIPTFPSTPVTVTPSGSSIPRPSFPPTPSPAPLIFKRVQYLKNSSPSTPSSSTSLSSTSLPKMALLSLRRSK